MSTMKTVALLSLTAFFGTTDAMAQSYEEYDAEERGEKPKVKRAVREIIKGTYAKTNVGVGLYFGPHAEWLQPGTSIALAVGQDFYDQEDMSMAWEVSFFQGINNGTAFDEQTLAGCVEKQNCIQGDIRSYTIVGLYEFSVYPTRRFGIGMRVGGGMMFTPLLMDRQTYEEDVTGKEWGYVPTVHEEPHPVVMGGPTFEYYTKMSHFSVGADIDALYAVGFDFGLSATATIKYTF
jgi:hypothetical protein